MWKCMGKTRRRHTNILEHLIEPRYMETYPYGCTINCNIPMWGGAGGGELYNAFLGGFLLRNVPVR